MRTNKYFGTIGIALITSILTLFAYSKFFNQKQIVYNYPNVQPKMVSYSGAGQQAVDLTYAAERTVHGVVHVRTKSKVETTFRNPLYEFFYGDGDITHSEPVMGFGSGVIISQDGYIVTNNHVIK